MRRPRAGRAPGGEFLAPSPVFHVIGWFVTVLGVLMLLPAAVDRFTGNPDWQVFTVSAAATVFVGICLIFTTHGPGIRVSRRQGFLLTTGVWLCSAAAGAVPLALSGLDMTVADAFFESMSGVTTTGSTVLSGLDDMPPGILLWRGILQWFGGIGFIVVGLAMLPFLKVGGMQLFRLESSEKSDKVVPQAKKFAVVLLLIYLAISGSCALSLYLAGMTFFEAVVHAMTTVSTGGFSTSDGSVGHFNNPTIDWIVVLFMTASSLPFLAYVQILRGRPLRFYRDEQIRTFIAFVTLTTLGLSAWLWLIDGFAMFDALTLSAFNVTSVITTTGFVTADYTQWGSLPLGVFFLLTFVGGCTGSTAGGLKMFRFNMLAHGLRVHIQRLIYPHGTFSATYNGQKVPEDVISGVLLFMAIYLMTTAVVSVALELMGIDFLTAFTGAATAISNVGPGLGSIIGPVGNFDTLPDAAKWVLSFAMLLGRLELFTVLTLLAPSFWRE